MPIEPALRPPGLRLVPLWVARQLGRALLAPLLLLSPASALPPPLWFAPAPRLRPGDHQSLELHLALPADAAEPLLVTLRREGHAIDVVKGRLLRRDARAGEPDGGLTFDVPIIARAVGTALLYARAQYFTCAAEGCSLATAEMRLQVEVAPAQ